MRSLSIKKFFTHLAVTLFVFAITMVGTAAAKSLYVLEDHHAGKFAAYNINPDGTVIRQAPYTIPYYGIGPSGLAVDDDSETLFSTFENSNLVALIDADTMTDLGSTTAPGATDLAGIDVDDVQDIVYTVDRGTNNLYAYDWDPVAKTLTLKSGYPITLPNCSGAYGIALDDIADILYVADGGTSPFSTGAVRAYDVNTWSEVMNFTPSFAPLGIAVDRRMGYVYTSAQDSYCGYGPNYNTLLSKYDLNTSTETTVDMGHGGMGIAVDEVTGYVYVTGGCSGDDLSVWDSSLNFVMSTGRIGNAAGLAIGNVSYDPLNLAKNDTIQGYGVHIGQTSTYEITYDNLDNAFDVTNVTVVDTLPAELDYVSSTPAGVYDSVAHTVTWDIGTLPAGDPGGLIELVVRVNQKGAAFPLSHFV